MNRWEQDKDTSACKYTFREVGQERPAHDTNVMLCDIIRLRYDANTPTGQSKQILKL